jgi:signal transduction histidine kinase/ligand-binding sensor domain-containing protein
MARVGRSGVVRWLAAWSAFFCFTGLASAMDPNRNISQYVREAWGPEQGFPGGTVYAMAETADGYLWVGAEKGLVRFDGLNFRLFNHANTPSLPSGPVIDLAAADGDLWIRMQYPNILRYHGGAFQEISPAPGQATNPITAMFREEGGGLLLEALGNITLRFSHGKIVQQRFNAPHSNFVVVAAAETGDGTIWLGTRETGLYSLSGSDGSAAPRGLRGRRINCLLAAGEKELWAGTETGLVRWDGTKITDEGVADSLRHLPIRSLMKDRDSNVWVGNDAKLVRIDANRATSQDSRARGPVTALLEDSAGNIWAGGAQGIERYRDNPFLTYATADDRRTEHGGALYADNSGRIWFTPLEGGLFYLKGGKVERVEAAGLGHDSVYSISGSGKELWAGRRYGGLTHLVKAGASFTATTYTRADGLAQDAVYTVLRTRDGSVWAGTVSGGVSRFRNGRFTTYNSSNGLASDSVSSILEGADGTIWIATANGLNAFTNDTWRVYTGREGLPSGHINCLLEDSGRVFWIGTSEGLAFFRGGRVQPATGPETLREEILGMAEDASGGLWMTTSAHVLRANRSKLLSGGAGGEDVREFGARDGLLATEGVKRDRSVTFDSRGRIWFSMSRGISVVDPSRVTRNPAPATVHIQAITADGNEVGLAHAVRIPANSDRVIFAFAGVSLSAPERIKYRYRLDGLDHAWSAPTAAPEAGYSNLRPRPYRFRVMASATDGVWNGAEAAIPLEIQPMFWQTWLFYAAAALVCGLAISGLYLYRMQLLAQQLNLRFEERLAERTRIAQELHDTLLQGVISASMQLHIAMDRAPADSPVRPPLGHVLELMGRVIEEGRNTVQGLRSSYSGPPDLGHAFSAVPQELALPAAADFRVIVEGQPRPLRPVLRDEVYRIGREAVINAFRHSQATRIEVEVGYNANTLRVFVRDNGVGIDPQALSSSRDRHWGLHGMRERAERIGAKLRVWSSATAGTEIDLAVPGQVAFLPAPSNRRIGRLAKLFAGRSPGIIPEAGTERTSE